MGNACKSCIGGEEEANFDFKGKCNNGKMKYLIF